MKQMKILNLAVLGLVLTVLTTGCSSTPTTGPGKDPKKDNTSKDGNKDGHQPHGTGPNDGVVFDLGAFHAEFTVDHGKKECTILFVTEDKKDAKPVPVACKELTVTTKESKTKEGTKVAPMTIKMTPRDEKSGKAATFVGTDPGLGNVADFEGTVVGEIDGKPAEGTFKEEAHK